METYLKIKDIKLWARVGVLEKERDLGQLFSLDVFLWADFENCTQNDDIKSTVDYSKLVQILKYQSKKICCFTIEKYSNEILKIFTDKKILWGSDWPVCNLRTDYIGWFNTAQNLTNNLILDQKQNIFYDNAIKFYKLKI